MPDLFWPLMSKPINLFKLTTRNGNGRTVFVAIPFQHIPLVINNLWQKFQRRIKANRLYKVTGGSVDDHLVLASWPWGMRCRLMSLLLRFEPELLMTTESLFPTPLSFFRRIKEEFVPNVPTVIRFRSLTLFLAKPNVPLVVQFQFQIVMIFITS